MIAARSPRACRVCGCTQDNACVDADGGPCSWVEEDLCSACAETSALPADAPLADRLTECLAKVIDTPLLTLSPNGDWPVHLRVGAFKPDLGEWAAEVLLDAEDRFGKSFQERVQPWLLECFGEMIAGDREERNHRFLEEAVELVQALGCTQSEAHQLVGYVFSRPAGDPKQETGGVMVTLAALCTANKLDMQELGETELGRNWGKVEEIRANQAAKPKHSALPGVPA